MGVIAAEPGSSPLVGGLGWGRRRPAAPTATGDGIDPGSIDGRHVYQHNMYMAGQVSTLMARYVRIRGDLLLEYSSLQADDASGRQAAFVCRDFLASARQELESRLPSLAVVANLLGLAERMLVTTYRPEILRLRVHSFIKELQSLQPTPTAEIAALRYAARDLDQADVNHRHAVETALKDAITYINRCAERDLIEDDLQVSRLSRLRWYLVFAWILLLVAIPIVSSVQTLDEAVIWPVFAIGRGQEVDLLLGALGLSIVGAVGGVVSGMLNVRDSRATMLDYRTSMKRLALKPMVGAVAALVIYLFLSAHMISGIEITSAGTYVVLGFMAGFSERYFLTVLNAQADPQPNADASSRSQPAASTEHEIV